MKYATPVAFRQALEQRLRAEALAQQVPITRLRKNIVFDRLLARLLVVAPDRWVLKGALALDFRFGHRARTTMDMDLVRSDTERAATADFRAAQETDLDDFFTFVIERTKKLDDLIDGTAVRYHVTVSLAGRRFDDAIVDVGFGSPTVWPPETVRGSGLLTFAGIDAISVPTLPLEQHVAEKVHAYTRGYDTGGSSRPKDLVDLVLLRDNATFVAGRLRTALEATFNFRKSHVLPDHLPLPPANWDAPYRAMASSVGIDPDLSRGHEKSAGFLDPVLQDSIPSDAKWNHAEGAWSK